MAERVLGFHRATILEQGPAARRWILCVVVAGVPLLFLRFTNDPFNVPKLGLLIAGVGIVASIRIAELLQGASARSLARLAVPANAVFLPLLIAWILSPYKYWSLFGEYGRFQGLLPYVTVIMLGVLVADAFADDLRHLAWALSVAGGVAGAYAVIQFIGIDPFTWTQQFGGATTRTSTLGNPNFTGGFLAMVLPVSVALWREDEEHARHHWKLVLAIGAGLVLSFSQGPYAAALAGAVVFAGFWFSGRLRGSKILALVMLIAIVVVVLGLVVFAMGQPDSDIVPATTAQRALWWRGALSMAAEHPLAGRGPNAYAVEGPRHRPVEDAAVHGLDFSNDTHSVPFAFLTSAGALGLLGYVVVMAWVAWMARRVDPNRLLQIGLLAAAVVYFVQSLVSIDEIALRTTLWAVLGGLAASFYTEQRSDSRNNSRADRQRGRATQRARRADKARYLPAVAIAALASVALLWWAAAFIVNDARVRSGIAAFQEGQADQGQRAFDRAIAFRGDYHYRHLNGFAAGQVAVEQGETGDQWVDETLNAYSFLDDFPRVPALVDYARFLLSYSEFDPALRDEAADAYLRLTRLDPNNLRLLEEAAEALTKIGSGGSTNLLRSRIDRLNRLPLPQGDAS